jgi:hypothetical protein
MIIKVNNTEVAVSHEVKADSLYRTSVHVTATLGDVTHTHVVTVRSVDEPIPVGYDLQKDVDAARQHCAEMAESKARAKRLAASLV